MSHDQDSPSFWRSFEQWRVAVTSMVPPTRPVRCEEQQPPSEGAAPRTDDWSKGKIMEPGQDQVPVEKTAEELKREAKECKRCERWRDDLTKESPIIRFLCQHISLLPPPPESLEATESPSNPTPNLPLPITCRPCPPTLAGGYSSTLGILLCQNRFMSKGHMEDAMAHELVHAYDGRRFEVKGEWGKDLRAHACTEIRAENLSGDCAWGREFTRRNWSWTKQQQVCVRRRAILSVAANPNCPSREEAEKAVNEVWESCWSDTRPFDEIY